MSDIVAPFASLMLTADELVLITQTLAETTFSGKLDDLPPALDRASKLRAKLSAALQTLAAKHVDGGQNG